MTPIMKIEGTLTGWLLAGLLLLLPGLVSCHKDYGEEDEYANEPEVTLEELNPKVVSEIDIPLYDLYRDMMQALTEGNDPTKDAQIEWLQGKMDALYKQAEEAAAAEGGNDLMPAILAILQKLLLKIRVMTYSTLGADGRMIESSMLVAWPYNFLKPNPHPDHLILGCHATIASNVQRPTNYENLSFSTDVRILVGEWASTTITLNAPMAVMQLFTDPAECLVVMPDYEGYGNTVSKPHPYLNRDLQGRQCVDAAVAAFQWYEANEKKMEDGWKTVSIGYSQGGAVAAASYRYWLEHKTRYRKLNFAGAVCGDGPYDPYATLKFYVSRNEMDMPCAPALVIKGMMDTDKEMIAAGARLEDYLTEDFIKTGIFDGISTKNKKTDDLDDMVEIYSRNHPGTLKYNKDNNILAESVLNPATFAFFKDGTLPADKAQADKLLLLKHCLRKNALNYKSDTKDWMPPAGSKFSFFHSPLDIVVPYDNLTSLKQSWGENNKCCRYIRYDAKISGHTDIGAQFMLEDMVGETYLLLKDKWTAKNFHMDDKQWLP